MILIGDIHITQQVKGRILDTIKNFCTDPLHAWHKDIVFMGDYVYHFNYDRQSLLSFLALCIELSQQGKHIHLMAGNHDRLQEHFVYAEAESILATMNNPNITIYTTPKWTKIDNIDCLFFPFMHPKDLEESQDSAWRTDHMPTWWIHERTAKKASLRLHKEIEQRRRNTSNQYPTGEKQDSTAIIFHHRYIANTQFPWIQWTFPFKSPALDPRFLEYSDIRLISWHIHSSFMYKNYLCTWSIWATSPLEINHQKWIYTYDASTHTAHAYSTDILHYVQIALEEWSVLDAETLKKTWQEIKKTSLAKLTSPLYTTHHSWDQNPSLSRQRIHVVSKHITYDSLPRSIEENILSSVDDIKIKHMVWVTTHDIGNKLQIEWGELQQRLSSWKQLLDEYLEKKYADSAQRYKTFLEALELLP